jgi:hypothetical protein
MPLYTFKNTKTDEEYDEVMSYEELQEYLKQEDIHQVFKMNIYRYSDAVVELKTNLLTGVRMTR